MLVGIVVLVLAYAVAWALKLTMITYLLGLVFTYGVFALLIVFQPELRAALAHLGQARFARFFRRMEATEVAEEIADAVERLSRSGIGAIIAIEREMPLGDLRRSRDPRCRRRSRPTCSRRSSRRTRRCTTAR